MKDFRDDKFIAAANLSNDGVAISVQPGKISLASKTAANISYPVTEFLKRYLKARVFDSTGVKVPAARQIVIPAVKYAYNPPFSERDVYYKSAFDDTFMRWNKVNHIWASKNSQWGNYVHTAYEFIDARKYIKSNPEYFALVKNKRITSQLCYSNKEVYAIVLANLKEKIRRSPEKKIWSFSQLDNNDICQCDLCMATDKRLETHGGPILEFVNRLAKDIPDKEISTLAYGFSLKPPPADKFRLEDNVIIVYCITQGNKGRDFSSDESFKDMRQFLTSWLKLTKKVIIWDYIVNFPNLLMPYPNFKGMAQAVNYYRRLGLRSIFLQGNIRKGGDFGDMRAYIASQLLWNPAANMNELIAEYSDYAYGPASGEVQSLVKDLTANGNKAFLNSYNAPKAFGHNMFTSDNMRAYHEKIDRALSKTSRGTPYYLNLMQIKLSFDITDMDLLKNQNQGQSRALPGSALKSKMADLEKYSTTGLLDIPVNENNRTVRDYINTSKKELDKE
ncbi:DUF4838 domain-containing protein [Chitinophaga sp. YIM B06452]|uniref:DUF4838 domain-containing protein n=1 Tax=Chitinophaga sp. YIM B06452 TaxID=3082158 RepID=UPI0031FF0A95